MKFKKKGFQGTMYYHNEIIGNYTREYTINIVQISAKENRKH